jgi:hypothetical protein
MKAPLLYLIDKVEKHISTDLKTHVEEDSPCKWHSYRFLFDGLTAHEANTSCVQCNNIDKVGNALKDAIGQMNPVADFPDNSREDPKSYAKYAEKLIAKLNTYWSHKIRSFHEESVMQKLTDELKDHEVLIISDFKMKMQMLLFRESMVEFFWKRGFPWLGFMVVRKRRPGEDVDNECVVEFLDYVVDGAKEDGYAVASMLEAMLKKYKTKHLWIISGKLMRDGAGCFSGLVLFLFLTEIKQLTGIAITDHLVTEAGYGKSPLDTHFAYCNTATQQGVLAGQGTTDIYDAETTVHVLQSRGGITNSSSAVAIVDQSFSRLTEVKKFPNLSRYMHRKYEYIEGTLNCISVKLHTLSWRDANSVTKSKAYLDSLWKQGKHPGSLGCILNLPSAASMHRSKKQMVMTTADKGKKKRVQQSKYTAKVDAANAVKKARRNKKDSLIEHSKLFHCVECGMSFTNLGNYDNHMLFKHYQEEPIQDDQSEPEEGAHHRPKQLIKDVLVEQVQAHSVELSSRRAIAAVTPVVIPLSVTESTQFDPGAKSCLKKSSASSRRTAAQLEFVVFIHKQGEDNKEKKVTGEKAREAMQLKGTAKGEKLFPNDVYMAATPDEIPVFQMIEWLEVGQIKAS